MDLKDKRVLIIGMALSGIAAAEVLCRIGAKVTVNDKKDFDELKDIEALKKYDVNFELKKDPIGLVDDADLIVVSPGVPLDQPFYKAAISKNIPVISEIELAYRMSKSPIIAITGTNGKTTTTSLTYEIFKNAGIKCALAGNIGKPLIKEIFNSGLDTLMIVEVSSFQLETAYDFKPKISAILNITPDHLNRHKTMENYINMKAKIFKNQDKSDFTVLNCDNAITKDLSSKAKSNVVFFSRKIYLDRGIYVKDGYMYDNLDGLNKEIIKISDIYIPGNHNIENALAAAAIARIYGIDIKVISDTLKSFKGIEHRVEYVRTIKGVKYYNDSKGTNTDASIKALEALKEPIVLIAGGYDKGEDFTIFAKTVKEHCKSVILLGTTKDKLDKSIRETGFNNIYTVDTLDEAVNLSSVLAKEGETVLLSPACASWDMFDSYEQRGKLFKEAVKSIKIDS